jgi:hypothetical protein
MYPRISCPAELRGVGQPAGRLRFLPSASELTALRRFFPPDSALQSHISRRTPGLGATVPGVAVAGRTTSERGYGWRHQQLRRALAPRVATGRVACWRCGELIQAWQEWHLGHDDDDRRVWRGPEHRYCNLSANAIRTNARIAWERSPEGRAILYAERYERDRRHLAIERWREQERAREQAEREARPRTARIHPGG